jgi:hypothetical protein
MSASEVAIPAAGTRSLALAIGREALLKLQLGREQIN